MNEKMWGHWNDNDKAQRKKIGSEMKICIKQIDACALQWDGHKLLYSFYRNWNCSIWWLSTDDGSRMRGKNSLVVVNVMRWIRVWVLKFGTFKGSVSDCP